jgi:hypothetical protein
MRETGTGQQVAQLHDRYMMMMRNNYSWAVLDLENEGTAIFRSAGNYSSKDATPHRRRIFCNAVVRNSNLAV